ncbi:hypothetical protein AVEN_88853-1 [Araneus ventricosus]|uniref:PiggyBac transposable element-derived protein domain-containing protein n=1 Tax=Araneus ventricosus TaxID=182803 RepID=A0A4Y2R529_ARAVE|nr:hypothetical protein AVEN_241736-1 [Araneus ventricosus]GBN70731.1 hypothetical protein AVEN_88853-1 [Araneus ventricosus]
MLAPYQKEMQRFRKLLGEVETDEDPDFVNEDNAPEDVLEEIFSDHESFSEHDTESEQDEDSGNEDMNNLEWFSSKDGVQWWKTKFRQNIRCHNIVQSLPGAKGPAKDVTNSVKSPELFINDDTIQLIVEQKNICSMGA